MGCFSSVCIVSKLPIYGHSIVGIPLSRQPYSGIACYPDAFWQLDGFPFYGDNDDYGRIENYEDKKYHKLNIKRYGEITEELIDDWCQPKGDKSMMFIHRPIWDELMKRWLGFAEAFYKELMERENFRWNGSVSREKFEETLKKLPAKKRKELKALIPADRKSPTFGHEGIGISHNFSEWCNKNYSPLIKTGLLDLIALNLSCKDTHTLFLSTYTVGEQISDWKEEASWTKFVAQFAASERKRRVKDC